MKIKISFEEQERSWAAIAVAALRRVLPLGKVKESDRHAPHLHVYIDIGLPQVSTCNNDKNMV